jgi:hypothetical protein
LVGADKDTPLAGLHVEITQGYGSQQKTFGPFTTDDTGTADVTLPPGFYSLHLQTDKELPYLPVEKVWNNRSRTTMPDLSISVKESVVAKWLDGKQREDGYEAPAKPGGVPRVTYTLLRACELTLRAVDAKTGKGLPGAEFYMENALGEDWAHDIENDTIQVKRAKGVEPAPQQANVSDDEGNFRRLVSANANYKYGVSIPPAGYVQVEPNGEVEVDVRYGQRSATQVFKFRRKK